MDIHFYQTPLNTVISNVVIKKLWKVTFCTLKNGKLDQLIVEQEATLNALIRQGSVMRVETQVTLECRSQKTSQHRLRTDWVDIEWEK